MYQQNVISVLDFFQSSSLHTREQANKLFEVILKKLKKYSELHIDFSNIEFISRSFADELVKLKSQFSTAENYIEFCCLSRNVRQMLEAVEHTQSYSKREKYIPVRQFENWNSLMHFLEKV
jgi:anti-anti-sigma regulatory factor